jgi:hypothetical protein
LVDYDECNLDGLVPLGHSSPQYIGETASLQGEGDFQTEGQGVQKFCRRWS